MDVIVIFNGLGNQMSQYALYLAKRRISPDTRLFFSEKSKAIHNGFELQRVFGIDIPESSQSRFLYFLFRLLGYRKFPGLSAVLIRLLNHRGIEIVNENDNYDFQPALMQPSKGIRFFVGGWHAEKYFLPAKQEVIDAFAFDENSLDEANQEMLKRIRTSNSVSVHVRRGDFLDAANFSKFGSVCSLDYFVRAMETLSDRLKQQLNFFFFTNDPAWVQTHFSSGNCILVNLNSGADSWKDMFLISQCRHHIGSNGSFSWWSAWLDRREESLVVVPDEFVSGIHFKDIYPPGWIRLSGYRRP